MGDEVTDRLKFVFCEGKDDEAVIKAVAQSVGLSDLTIEPFGGKNRLRLFLSQVQKRPEFVQRKVSTIAIIRDADDSAQAAFVSVSEALRANGFSPCPANRGEVTAQPAGPEPRVGIFIVSDATGRGMLEDLCLESVCDRPEFGCLDEYFRCIATRSDRKNFSSKARVRAWLSTHVDFELYVGAAADKGYWPWAHTAFQKLKEFLQRL